MGCSLIFREELVLSDDDKEMKMPFPVDEKYILQTEQKLGVKFPESFRKKMMEENGGSVETPPDAWDLYPFMDTSDRTRLKRTCNDIVRETASLRDWPGCPPTAVAIGANGCGDQLVLIPSENTEILQDAVFWWNHENGELSKVAHDFGDLM
jgi:hypothetical protein